jgi:Hint domain-containing protein
MIRAVVRSLFLLAVLVVAACAAPAGSTAPSATPGAPLTNAELRYRLIDTFGPLWFCDPDFYPIAVQDEAKRSVERFGEIQADSEAFAAIQAHLGIPAGADFTADQKLAIYRAWKQLNAILLEPGNNGTNRFDYRNTPAPGATESRRTTGTIDQAGTIAIEQQAPAGEPPCPICLARGTRIATPQGEVAVEDVRVGMRVWSIDEAGTRVEATVVLIGQTQVPASHEVVRLALDDGRVLRASPGHPLVDGRLLTMVRPGDDVDGATVLSAALEPYSGGSTFDLLTDSPTGGYIADGIPLGSTLVGG